MESRSEIVAEFSPHLFLVLDFGWLLPRQCSMWLPSAINAIKPTLGAVLTSHWAAEQWLQASKTRSGSAASGDTTTQKRLSWWRYSHSGHLAQAVLTLPPCHWMRLFVFFVFFEHWVHRIAVKSDGLGEGKVPPRYCLNLFTPCFVTELLSSLPIAAMRVGVILIFCLPCSSQTLSQQQLLWAVTPSSPQPSLNRHW